MKTIAIYLSLAGLLLTIIPPLFQLAGSLSPSSVQFAMILGMLLWFGASAYREFVGP